MLEHGLGALVGALLGAAAYFAARPFVPSDFAALAIAGAAPLAWTLARFAWTRKVDPFGVVAALGFGLALLTGALFGGNELVLKLHESPLLGLAGVALLASVAVGKPLLPRIAAWMGRPVASRGGALSTAILGSVLLVDFGARLALALALPTPTFVLVARPTSLAILGAGLGLLLLARRRSGSGAAAR